MNKLKSILGLLLISTLNACLGSSVEVDDKNEVVNVTLSSGENNGSFSSTQGSDFDLSSIFDEVISSSTEILNSSSVMISSSSGLSSSSWDGEFNVLFRNFPIQKITSDTTIQLTWETSAPAFEVILSYKLTDSTRVAIDTLQDAYTYDLDMSFYSSLERIRLEVEVLAAGISSIDVTGFFEIHSGLTELTYEASMKSFFSNYCIRCHGSSGGLNLETYTEITRDNRPLYILNRTSYIGDMPADELAKPSKEELAKLRDWILGGTPE